MIVVRLNARNFCCRQARLGAVVHKKTATALALTAVKPEDKHDFSKLVESVKSSFNERYDDFRKQARARMKSS